MILSFFNVYFRPLSSAAAPATQRPPLRGTGRFSSSGQHANNPNEELTRLC